VIIVTGANGTLGRRIAHHLLARVPATDVAVTVRDPAGAAPLAEQGADVRRADYDEPGTLAHAFRGAGTVFINGTNYGTPSAARARQQATAIQAAHAAGATRIVITSWHDLENCPLEMAADFPGTEELAAKSGTPWTILRLTFGMDAALARDVRTAMETGTLTAPAGAARATPAAPADLAEAAARVLTATGHEGATYELTGPDAVSWEDLAGLASRLAGKQIRYRPIPDAEFAGRSLAAGWPPAAVDGLLAYYAALRTGWAATPRPDLGLLLGRSPISSLEAVRRAAEG
jgi:NAD(P)H dehydrogenase (quinone)